MAYAQAVWNSYDGALPRWKVALARSRIVALGYPQNDWDELMQQLALEMLLFRYDPTRASAASESTALYALISNHLVSEIRARERAGRRTESLEEVLPDPGSEDDRPCGQARKYPQRLCCRDRKSLRLDVRDAVALLPAREQAVCVGLMEGETITQIARRLRCSWHTVRQAIVRIRALFEGRGLAAWLLG